MLQYFHVEIIEGILYVYIDGKPRDGKVVASQELGNDCDMGKVRNGKHIAVLIDIKKQNE